ncbi:alpha/beta fold hydrolase [Streptomyces sp. W1SF4]|uniref:thioesterase II family protein n=1 Tax=Streptomyces sp. W1SF4 TaxID=2305220 RepID=UPI000F6F5533|nr:alpha/beta fold hydrolase [Streptomyces sp. W1SF4]AZM94057.1 thioesterase [Streptomyces sp. W1SF4]
MSGAGAESPWIRRFHPPAVPPGRPVPVLVVLPHAGGSASFYFPFSRDLAAHAEVLTVQYPGRQERLGEPSPDTIAGLADGVERALEPWGGRPLVLFGHSMGAVLAYELARRMEAAGETPRGLIVSGRRSPLAGREEEREEGHLHARDDDALLAHVHSLSGTDPALLADPAFRELILPALRSDYRAVETWRHEPGPPLRTPVSVLCGDADPRASLAEARGWRDVAGAGFGFRGFPGGHFYLTEQHAAVVRAVAEDLAGFTAA